ncbi:MAG: hypothetical protein UIH27_01065 [Ruminococcus sp.]|nr:hypothetical protein [Ruminococcus sp.]
MIKKSVCIGVTGVILLICVCVSAFAAAPQSGEPAPEAPVKYVVKSERGRLTVYRFGESEPFMTTETFSSQLPKSDAERLRHGVEVEGEQSLRKTLEDYCS